MNPVRVDYRIACVFGIIVGAILLGIAVFEMATQRRAHVGLGAWGVWFVFASILVLVRGAGARAEAAASDSDVGLTFGFVITHLGQAVTLILILAGVLAAVLSAIFGM